MADNVRYIRMICISTLRLSDLSVLEIGASGPIPLTLMRFDLIPFVNRYSLQDLALFNESSILLLRSPSSDVCPMISIIIVEDCCINCSTLSSSLIAFGLRISLACSNCRLLRIIFSPVATFLPSYSTVFCGIGFKTIFDFGILEFLDQTKNGIRTRSQTAACVKFRKLVPAFEPFLVKVACSSEKMDVGICKPMLISIGRSNELTPVMPYSGEITNVFSFRERMEVVSPFPLVMIPPPEPLLLSIACLAIPA